MKPTTKPTSPFKDFVKNADRILKLIGRILSFFWFFGYYEHFVKP